jgi:hypothetical protein
MLMVEYVDNLGRQIYRRVALRNIRNPPARRPLHSLGKVRDWPGADPISLIPVKSRSRTQLPVFNAIISVRSKPRFIVGTLAHVQRLEFMTRQQFKMLETLEH